MKRILSAVLFICVIFFSCKKEIGGKGNRPPVANAGPDQTIILPTNTVALDGSASTDPDNNISSYLWTKISGPSSFNIAGANAVQTQVTNLVEGVYQFELKVTDAGGLFLKDTMQVVVNLGTNSPVDIYVAGIEVNNGVHVSKYWKNGTSIPISTYGGKIRVSGSDICVLGFGAYWKNGNLIPLNSVQLTPGAGDLVISGSDVYVTLVDLSCVAKYWKNGNPITLTSSSCAGASSIAVVGSDVYVAGSESNGSNNGVAKYWKNGVAVNLTDGTRSAHANSIVVVGSDVYVAGLEVDNGVSVAKYWKNGQAVPLTNGSIMAHARSIVVVGNDVYVLGIEGTRADGSGIFKYWKNGTVVPLTVPVGNVVAVAFDITVSGNDAYVAGYILSGYTVPGGYTVSEAVYWKNGIPVTLGNGYAYGIAVVP